MSTIPRNTMLFRSIEGNNIDILDLFANKKDCDALLSFLIYKGIIDRKEFETYCESLKVADKLSKE